MAMKSDSALEAFAHCCTAAELREFLETLSESGRERLKTHGHLALLRAVEFNKESAGVVRTLLDRPEIQVNLPHIGQDGNTILHFAVLLQDKEVVCMLLTRDDLDPNVGNRREETPVHAAVKKGSCLEILELLLSDPRVNVAALTGDRQTALHVACKVDKWGSASKDPQIDVVRKLLDSASKKVKSLVQFLESLDQFGRTALHYAAGSGLNETVDEILEALRRLQSSNVRSDHLAIAGDNKGCLAVHLAAQKGHLNVVKSLLAFGDCEDQDGLTALHHAVRSGREDNVQLCFRPNLSLPEYLKLLSLTTHLNIAESLLAKLYETHVKNGINDEKEYPTLLDWAVKIKDSDGHGALLITDILKWQPAKANECLDPTKQQTALHIATIMENQNAVQVLCSESASWDLNGNQCDIHDNTALDYAFKKENEPIQRILMERKDVKEHLARHHKNRATYAMASNAILVVAVLVATLTYARCLTGLEVAKKKNELNELNKLTSSPPSSETLSATRLIIYATMPTRVAFILSLMATILAAFAALPFSFGFFFRQTVDDNYVRRSLYRTRVLIVAASYCLVFSLEAVMFGFICSQYISPFIGYKCAMACEIVMALFMCLSVVFLGTNAVTLIWKSRKLKRAGWRLLVAV